MIISYAELKKKPRVLKGFAGVTAPEFEELEAKAEPIWRENEHKRSARLSVFIPLNDAPADFVSKPTPGQRTQNNLPTRTDFQATATQKPYRL